jgi:hypothetical protein
VTPSQELILEVLTARYRLGEQGWHFSTRLSRQIGQLRVEGWVRYKNAIIPNHLYVWPTQKLLDDPEMMSPDYVPPILRKEPR